MAQKGKIFSSQVYVRLVPWVQVVSTDWLTLSVYATVNIIHLDNNNWLG